MVLHCFYAVFSMFLACFKVGRYLEPKINLFHTLKLGPQSKESANFFNKVWDQDSRFVPQVSRLIQRQGSCGLLSHETDSLVDEGGRGINLSLSSIGDRNPQINELRARQTEGEGRDGH